MRNLPVFGDFLKIDGFHGPPGTPTNDGPAWEVSASRVPVVLRSKVDKKSDSDTGGYKWYLILKP